MRVFVTGAAGFIGQAVVEDLLKHGHHVLGLARSDTSAEAVKKAGAEVHRGDIEDLGSLKAGAQSADGVVHLAFIHDFTDYPRACAVDRAAITALAEAMTGTSKPLVIASGTLHLPEEQLQTENAGAEPGHAFGERAKSEDLVRALSKEQDIRGSVVRLSPTVHGTGDKAFVPMLINFARQNGFVTMVGDGSNRWPAVHRFDAAELFRLAVEKGVSGAVYHGVAEQVAVRGILGTIGKRLQLPVEVKSVEEAGALIGFFAHVVGRDNYVSNEKTQKELGWRPKQLGLIADMEGNYFS
ncbi:hypothetical protein LTR37_015103 [Vermiconidia calcicola]|uniref:Uncharacterized protein n=1 Tax=Vermiconidia calcicola TaxID=1690605 RepID=A0ACC3MSG2_9PEZI|nr:hypothetical protein LTR37_015103 [Vermiconidia calcicola]